jgi:hypothetical protein
MNPILQTSEYVQQKAFQIIEDLKIYEIWSSIGATVNLVGSLKMRLLINHRDIDFHVYTNPFILEDSFSAAGQMAGNGRVQSINYINRLERPDKCIEWHFSYEDSSGDLWQIDIIHILTDSPYAGYFEKVADRICQVLTPKQKETILKIKHSIASEEKVIGIYIYKAVIESGVHDLESFRQWYKNSPKEEILTWIP